MIIRKENHFYLKIKFIHKRAVLKKKKKKLKYIFGKYDFLSRLIYSNNQDLNKYII